MPKQQNISRGQSGAAVRDVQKRLASIRFDLGEEVGQGVFGPKTAQAVRDFRKLVELPVGEVVDTETWVALVDATFTFGNRVLYLRMPYFHGSDVAILQTALVSLGFSCTPDGIFGAHTERAVREFQMNAGFKGDGIVGDATYASINRLRHAWEGREMIALGDRPLGFARAAAVLENTPICVFGTDNTGRAIAERISNLAVATTPASQVVSAQSLDQVPSSTTLMIQLIVPEAGSNSPAASAIAAPQVVYDNDISVNARLRTALELTTPEQAHIDIWLLTTPDDGQALSAREEQHAAIILLDAICQAFD